MKKYFLALLLIILIAPSVAFASWWNPFSWNIFNHKTQTTTVVVPTDTTQNKSSEEPQKQQQNIPTTNTEIKKVIPTSTTKTNKKQIQVQATPTITQNQTVAPVINDVCKNIEGVQTVVPSGMYLSDNDCLPSITTTPTATKTAPKTYTVIINNQYVTNPITLDAQQIQQRIDKINSDFNSISASDRDWCYTRGHWKTKTDSTCYPIAYKDGEIQYGVYDTSNYDIYYNMSFWLPQYQAELNALQN